MTAPADRYRAAFAAHDVLEFPVDGLDRLGVPVHATAAWTERGVFCNGVGYGATRADAEASAWGELAESWAAHEWTRTARPVVASYATLAAVRGGDAVLDPRRAPLPAGSDWTADRDVAWLPAQGAAGEVLVPVELVASRFADLPRTAVEPLLTPVTNGLGAGLDRDQAFGHGVRELLQRDGNSVAYRALDGGVGIDLDGLEDPAARALLARYDAAGVEVRVKLAGVTCGMASVYCVGWDRDPADAPHPLALAACGEAAHPRRDEAVRKALLEFAAARSRRLLNHGPLELLEPIVGAEYLDRFRDQPLRSEEDRSLAATREWAHLSAARTLERLQPIHAVTREVALTDLPDDEAGDLRSYGLEALWVAFDGVLDGVHAGKAIVGGLEVESLSYGRVGPRNLQRLLERGVDFVGLGEPPAGAEPLVLGPGEPAAWLHRGRMDAVVGDLYALYREPGRHVVAMTP